MGFESILSRLKVRANPQGNLASVNRPDRPKHSGAIRKKNCWKCWFSNDTYSAVMPLDVLGCTRATLTETTSGAPCLRRPGKLVKLCRAGDRAL